jgi:hypothetical protein
MGMVIVYRDRHMAWTCDRGNTMKVIYGLIVICLAIMYAAFFVYVYQNNGHTGNLAGILGLIAVFYGIMTVVISAESETWEAIAIMLLIVLIAFLPWVITYLARFIV